MNGVSSIQCTDEMKLTLYAAAHPVELCDTNPSGDAQGLRHQYIINSDQHDHSNINKLPVDSN